MGARFSRNADTAELKWMVPLCLIGILPMLFVTGSAVNVQSLLGFIFIVGIKVANTVLMTDYAQELRRHEGLSPLEAIRKAVCGVASIRCSRFANPRPRAWMRRPSITTP